jgi:hypothetical protein
MRFLVHSFNRKVKLGLRGGISNRKPCLIADFREEANPPWESPRVVQLRWTFAATSGTRSWRNFGDMGLSICQAERIGKFRPVV